MTESYNKNIYGYEPGSKKVSTEEEETAVKKANEPIKTKNSSGEDVEIADF